MEEYKGYIKLDDAQMADFYSDKFDKTNLYENEYVMCGTDVYCYQNKFLRKVEYPTIKSEWGGMIKPRNIEQYAAIDMLNDNTSQIKLICGPWGSGKTLLLAAGAMQALEQNEFDRIVWIRNNVQVKDTDTLGALPGLI